MAAGHPGTEALPIRLFGDLDEAAEHFGPDDISVIQVLNSTAQAHLNLKLVQYFQQLKAEDHDVAILDSFIAEAGTGLCFGYSICFNAMLKDGKLDWWFQALAILASWDGKASSLNDLYELSGREPVSLRELFERVSQYVLYHQKHFFNLHQQKILAPAEEGEFTYYEKAGMTPLKKGEARTVEQVRDTKILHHVHFDASALDEALDPVGMAGNEVILEGYLKPGSLGKHIVSVGYKEGQWYFYDSNRNQYKVYEDKAKPIAKIASTYNRLNHIILTSTIGPITLTPKQAPYAEFNHFLDCWQRGLSRDYGHYYLSHYEQIEKKIAVRPKVVESFFCETFKRSPIKNLSLTQKAATVNCLMQLPEPSHDTKKLLRDLLTERNEAGVSLLEVLIKEAPADFLLVHQVMLHQTQFGYALWYQILMREGGDVLDPLAKAHPAIMEAVADSFAAALPSRKTFCKVMLNLSPYYFGSHHLYLEPLVTPKKLSERAPPPGAPVKEGVSFRASPAKTETVKLPRLATAPTVTSSVAAPVVAATVAEPVSLPVIKGAALASRDENVGVSLSKIPVPPASARPHDALVFKARNTRIAMVGPRVELVSGEGI